MKPILFNTEEVQATLDNRKAVTRRVVKPQPKGHAALLRTEFGEDAVYTFEDGTATSPHYRPGDILYVRETWTVWNENYEYKADVDDGYGPFCSSCTLDICAGDCNSALKWRPSIHMPQEAARIFLRVTDVRVERLQNINERGPFSAVSEGFTNDIDLRGGTGKSAIKHFSEFWDSTIKPKDRALYGWVANPWVWVIEFERVSREEAERA